MTDRNHDQMPPNPDDPLAFEEPLFDPSDTPPHGVRVPPSPPTNPSLLRRPQGLIAQAPAKRFNSFLSVLMLIQRAGDHLLGRRDLPAAA